MTTKKIMVYGLVGVLLLLLVIVLVPNGDDTSECVDRDEYAVQVDHTLMQTGDFKSVNTLITSDEFRLTVEPSDAGLADSYGTKDVLYSAAAQTPACLGIESVKITLVLPEHNTVLQYPFTSAINGTEDADLVKSIEQR
jgi:hypothetical protein